MKNKWLGAGLIIIVFGLGTAFGSFLTQEETTYQAQIIASAEGEPHLLQAGEIIFADEDKRDFIEEHAQFMVSPEGDLVGLDGRDTKLVLMHDKKDDWFYYFGAFIDREEVIEEYEVSYEDHREMEGGPSDTMFP